MRNRPIQTVTIAEDESLTEEIDLQGYELVAIHMPDGWTTADLTFQAAARKGGTFQDLYDADGNEVTVDAAEDRVIIVPFGLLRGVNYIKVRSGTGDTPVSQLAARDLILALRVHF